ncbi:MAG: hypothetical protein WCL08_12505, partial [Verrucomicrobiota bacterium]
MFGEIRWQRNSYRPILFRTPQCVGLAFWERAKSREQCPVHSSRLGAKPGVIHDDPTGRRTDRSEAEHTVLLHRCDRPKIF